MKKPVKIFFIVLITLSVILNLMLAKEGSIKTSLGQSLVLMMMFVPTISYIVTRFICKSQVGKVKLRFGKIKAIILAYLLPFIYVSITYGIIWCFGFYKGNFDVTLLLIGLAGTIVNVMATIGEEIGWRGFLLDEFLKTKSPLAATISVGLIWSLWHIPGLIFTDYGNTVNLIYGIPFFVISLTMLSIPMSYFVLKANNIWPAILMHASHNALIQAVYETMTIGNTQSAFLKDETGLILMLLTLSLGLFFAFKLKKLQFT